MDFNPEAPLEDKVEFLLRRNIDSQREVNALARRIAALEEEGPPRAAELRSEMEKHVERELATAREDNRTARVIGAVLLHVRPRADDRGNFV